MDEKELGKLIKRRHPEYKAMLSHWLFLELCYRGGRDWFGSNIFRYIKEGEKEFAERVERAYRFNHSKEVVDLVGKYIFKSKISRNHHSAPKEIKKFWAKSNRNGSAPIQKLIREAERMSSIYGRIWCVIDNNRSDDNSDGREYGYFVTPPHALDMSYGDDGMLNWILISETYRDDSDPFTSSGDVSTRFRLWTRNDWYLIEVPKQTNGSTATNGLPTVIYPVANTTSVGELTPTANARLVASGRHGLGVVPVFPIDHNESDEPYSSPSLISDIAYLDRACANYLSNLDAIIQDQTFSQLAMPAQGVMPGDSSYEALIDLGTKRVFLYDGEGGSAPFYLSPDPKQAEIIITVISKIINEIYHTVGMAGERTKQDNSVGIDNSSGVAKAYDFERVNALLATKAASLRRAEIRMCMLVMKWNGVDDVTEEEIGELITYPETFDVRGLADEFSIATNLSLIEAPSEMRKEQLRILVDKLFPMIKSDLKEKMLKEIDSANFDVLAGIMQEGGVKNEPNTGMKGNRQGENNK